MSIPRHVVAIVSGLMVLAAGVVSGQNYPNKPIRIVTAAAGGSNDFIQMLFDDAPTLMPNIKLGKLKALAVTSSEPSALAPGLPTMAAAGVPGYVFESTQGVWAPAKTPQAIIKRLNQELVRLVNQPDIKEKLFASGLEPVGNTPEQFGAMIKSDMANMSKVIQAAGICAD